MVRLNLRGLLRILRWTAFISILMLVMVPIGVAYAHTPDMYGQTQAIDITKSGLQVDWHIMPGPLLADAVWNAADQNQDGSISSDEAQAWVAPFLSGLTFSVDGQLLDSLQTQGIRWSASKTALRTGEDAIEVLFAVSWPDGLIGKHTLEIHNSYLEVNSLNWFSLTAESGMSFDSPEQDNGQLSFSLNFPERSSTPSSVAGAASMTSWNSGTPDLPSGFAGSVSQLAGNLAGSQSGASTQPAPPGNLSQVTAALEGLVKTPTFSPLFLLGAFLLSMVLGSLHALTPGHGKTLVAAYLVGTHGKVRDAVFLGAVVTITHTGSVILLGLVTLLASHYVLPTLIAPWLEIISGLLVVGFGASLFLQRNNDLRKWLRRQRRGSYSGPMTDAGRSIQPGTANLVHAHGGGLVHQHDHPHDANGEHDHFHGVPSTHRHVDSLPAGQVTWRSLLALGVSGGLVPCPDAIAILLVAVAVNRIPFGMMLIVSFSIGLALVLIAIGIAMVQGMRLVTRSEALTRFSIYAPMISALVVTVLGIALTVGAVNSLKFVSSVVAVPSPAVARPGTAPNSQPEAFDIKRARLIYVAPENSQGRSQIYMLNLAGGDPVQWTQEPTGVTGYTLSPDKQTILYTTFNVDSGSSIWAINADGTGRHLLLDCPQAECNAPLWYPDGRKIIYERLEDTTDPSALPKLSLWWLDVQTGETLPVFRDQTFPSTAAAFSPDGQWLSYILYINNTLQLYNLQEKRSLSLPLTNQSAWLESWSPTSDSILYWGPTAQDSNAAPHVQRYILSSGETIDLGGGADQTDYSAVWSPSGDWIAVDRVVSTSVNAVKGDQVWLVRPDGTGAQVLLGEDQKSYSDLSWSPDGKYIVYARYDYQNAGHFDVGLVNVQTGEQVILVSGGSLPSLLP